MLSGGEGNQTRPTDVPHKAKAEAKHWLEYAIFIFVIATAVATEPPLIIRASSG